MEPAINPNLTHSLIAPFDMTLAEMHDMGWFTDANLDGTPDQTVLLNGCDTTLGDDFIGNGALLADQARVWYRRDPNPCLRANPSALIQPLQVQQFGLPQVVRIPHSPLIDYELRSTLRQDRQPTTWY